MPHPVIAWIHDRAHRRWLRVAGAVGAIVLLVAMASPFGLSLALETFLKDRGARDVHISDVDLNIFTTRFAVRGLNVDRETGRPVEAGDIEGTLSVGQLVRGRVMFDDLVLRNVRIVAARDGGAPGWRVGGLNFDRKDGDGGGNEGGAVVGVRNLRILDSSLRLRRGDGHMDFTITDGRIDNFVPWRADARVSVNVQGRLADAPVTVNGTLRPGGSDRGLEAKVTVRNLSPSSLAVLTGDDAGLPAGRVDVTGSVTAKFNAAGLSRAVFNGSADGREMSYPLDGPSKVASAAGVSWAGQVILTPPSDAGKALQWQVSGRAELSDVAVPLRDAMTLRLSAASVDEIKADSAEDIRAGSVVVRDAVVAPQGDVKPLPFTASSLRATDIALTGGPVLSIASIVSDDAHFGFIRRETATTGIHDLLGGAPAAPGAPSLGLRIGRIDAAKGGSVTFRDETVVPVYDVDWRLAKGEVTALDSTRPDTPMHFDFSGPIGTYDSLTIAGQARPFRQPVTADLDAALKGIDLPPLSPYLERYAGYTFRSGAGDMSVKAKVDKDGLDARAIIDLRAMKVAPARAGAASAAEKALSMPVEGALSLLRDSNNDIHLEIPVKGDPLAPEFDLGGVFAKAATGALRTAGIGFLKYALQPFGAALMVGELARDFAASVRLEPAVFAAGGKTLTAMHRDYLARLGKLLHERPALRLQLCGRATAADRAALAATEKVPEGEITDQRLLDLAVARADAFRDGLAESGIDPGRIIACEPEIDTSKDSRPRVEFTI